MGARSERTARRRTTGNGGNLGDIALPPGQVTSNPVTAGNRSGDGAISRNNIDAIRATLISTPDGSRVSLGTVADVEEAADCPVELLAQGISEAGDGAAREAYQGKAPQQARQTPGEGGGVAILGEGGAQCRQGGPQGNG